MRLTSPGAEVAYDALAREMKELHRFVWMNVNHAWAVVAPDATGLATYGQGTPWFEHFGLVADRPGYARSAGPGDRTPA